MTVINSCKLTMGERLNDVMKERKLTQIQLADGAGVSQSQISAICRDVDRGINHQAIYKICKYLDVSADWLLGLSETRNPDPTLQAACEYTGLSEQAIETIRRISKTAAPAMNYFFTADPHTLLQLFISILTYLNHETVFVGEEGMVKIPKQLAKPYAKYYAAQFFGRLLPDDGASADQKDGES